MSLKQRSIRILNREKTGESRVHRFKLKQYAADLNNFLHRAFYQERSE